MLREGVVFGIATEGLKFALPFEGAGVEDVNARRFTREVLTNVAADYDHLAVPNVACVPSAGIRDGLTFHINLDPFKTWDRQDPHVIILDLLSVWNEVLATEHVYLVTRATMKRISIGKTSVSGLRLTRLLKQQWRTDSHGFLESARPLLAETTANLQHRRRRQRSSE